MGKNKLGREKSRAWPDCGPFQLMILLAIIFLKCVLIPRGCVLDPLASLLGDHSNVFLWNPVYMWNAPVDSARPMEESWLGQVLSGLPGQGLSLFLQMRHSVPLTSETSPGVIRGGTVWDKMPLSCLKQTKWVDLVSLLILWVKYRVKKIVFGWKYYILFLESSQTSKMIL
jgi:hypothetical protein